MDKQLIRDLSYIFKTMHLLVKLIYHTSFIDIMCHIIWVVLIVWATMNLMRKLRGASSSASSDAGEATGASSHVQLGLMHLKKLFAEYTHPPQPLTDAEKDDKLYNMLPLFCKVTFVIWKCWTSYKSLPIKTTPSKSCFNQI